MRVLLQTVVSIEVADVDEIAKIIRDLDRVSQLNLASVLEQHQATYTDLTDAGFINYGASALLPLVVEEDA